MNLEKKEGAEVRAAFLYPPSKTFADEKDGWWSWPGNEFDAEGRQKKYMAALRGDGKKDGNQNRYGGPLDCQQPGSQNSR